VKEKEKREAWTKYVSLTVVVIAVVAAIASQAAGKYGGRTQMSQAQASDQWAYYQAKSIKGYLYELQKEKLELDLKLLGPKATPSLIEDYQKKIDGYAKNIKRYNDEKAQIEKDARNFEAIKVDATVHAQTFGMAVIFLQIAILLSSIAALMKKKPVWILGLVTGAVGVFYFINGFFLFVK
jgi:hypothetical protein